MSRFAVIAGVGSGLSESEKGENTTSAKVKWIEAYKSGNLTEAQFKEKVIFQSSNESAQGNLEIEILEKIFKGKVEQIQNQVKKSEDPEDADYVNIRYRNTNDDRLIRIGPLSGRLGTGKTRKIIGYGVVVKIN